MTATYDCPVCEDHGYLPAGPDPTIEQPCPACTNRPAPAEIAVQIAVQVDVPDGARQLLVRVPFRVDMSEVQIDWRPSPGGVWTPAELFGPVERHPDEYAVLLHEEKHNGGYPHRHGPNDPETIHTWNGK